MTDQNVTNLPQWEDERYLLNDAVHPSNSLLLLTKFYHNKVRNFLLLCRSFDLLSKSFLFLMLSFVQYLLVCITFVQIDPFFFLCKVCHRMYTSQLPDFRLKLTPNMHFLEKVTIRSRVDVLKTIGDNLNENELMYFRGASNFIISLMLQKNRIF